MGKRSNGEGFIRQKPGRVSLWEIRVSVVQHDGTKKQRTFYAPSYDKAKAKLSEVRTANEQGRLRPETAPKLEALVKDWLTFALPVLGLKRTTVETYRFVAKGCLLEDPIVKTKLDKVRPRDVEDFLLRLANKGLGTSSQRISLTILRKVFERAIRDGHVYTNPTISVTRPKRHADPATRWVTFDELFNVFHELRGTAYLPAILFMAISGLRRGEALALTWQDLDFDNRRVSIRSTMNRVGGTLEVSLPKTTNSRRTLHMTSEMYALFQQLKNSQSASPESFVFQSSVGAAIEPRNMLRSFKAAAKRAGLPQLNLHSLRHAAASQMLNSGVPLFTVSKTLGHSSVAVTGDIYGHLEDKAQKDAINALSDQFMRTVMAQKGGTSVLNEAGAQELAGLL